MTQSVENLNYRNENNFSFKGIYGIVSMLISRIASTTLSFLVKLLFVKTNITVFEIVYFRAFVLFFGVFIHSKVIGIDAFKIEKINYCLILIRMIFGYLSNIITFYQYKVLPLSIAMIIYNIYPLFTSILAYYILNEKLSKYDILGLFCAFIGVILIAYNPSPEKNDYNPINLIIPVIAGIFSSLGDIYAKKLTLAVNNIYTSPLFYSISALFLSPITYILISYGNLTFYNFEIISICGAAGIMGWFGIFFLTIALKFEKAGRVAIFSYLGIILAMLYDLFYFKRSFNNAEIIGCILIVGMNFLITALKISKIIE